MTEAAKPALIADIGGTNARFALAEFGARDISLRAERVYRTADFPGLQQALEAWLADARLDAPPQAAALAVACPVLGDRIELTNRAWSFSRSGLQNHFRFRQLQVLNDFAAVAHALPYLKASDLRRIGGPPAEEAGAAPVLAVLGPGTGLGVAALVATRAGFQVIPSEGGHASFAPADETEVEILRRMQARHGHVSFERVLSGPGLAALCTALAEIEGTVAAECEPARVVRCALAGEDAPAVRTLELYCAILGGFAGNIALTFGAGRVFIGGGIVPRFPEFLAGSAFRARFEAKGRFTALLRTVPVDVILRREPGMLGAAMALRAELEAGSGN